MTHREIFTMKTHQGFLINQYRKSLRKKGTWQNVSSMLAIMGWDLTDLSSLLLRIAKLQAYALTKGKPLISWPSISLSTLKLSPYFGAKLNGRLDIHVSLTPSSAGSVLSMRGWTTNFLGKRTRIYLSRRLETLEARLLY